MARKLKISKILRSQRAWRKTLATEPRLTVRLVIILYLIFNAILTAGILKTGAGINYLIPVMGACSIMLGLLTVESMRRIPIAARRHLSGSFLTVIFFGISLYVWEIYHSGARRIEIPSPERRAVAARTLERIEAVPGPVWSEDMTLTMIAGKDVIAEPAIVTQLATQGIWNQEPFLNWFRERKFDAIIIKTWSQARFTPEIKKLIETNYPAVEIFGKYKIYYPAHRQEKYTY